MKLFDKLPIYIVMRDEIGLEGALVNINLINKCINNFTKY